MKYLITGGTGTFGRALTDRLISFEDATEIRIFSRDEAKQHDMMQEITDSRVKYFIGDVRNRESLKEPMRGVDYVFHAAAMKHVWSCEQFPLEAFATNVTGTANTIDAAIEAGVKKYILLSSDKAVYPVGVMGATKFLAERVLLSKMFNTTTTMYGVRFGNLINSRGSVVGVWRKQLSKGRSCAMTDPSATRFIMTIEQALDLVERVFHNDEPGEIKIYEAKACTVRDLFIAVTGTNDNYRIIGLQPGEKKHEWLTEELCSEDAERFTIDELRAML